MNNIYDEKKCQFSNLTKCSLDPVRHASYFSKISVADLFCCLFMFCVLGNKNVKCFCWGAVLTQLT